MLTFMDASRSSIGKKFISGATGFGLVVFVVTHLTGNLTLLLGPEAFNAYTKFLHDLLHGAFIWIADIGLILFFGGHAVTGISVARKRRQARPIGYSVSGDAGGQSRKSVASRSMILSGLLLLVYVVFHVWHLKFGPHYVTLVDGEESRDLYRLVVEEFNRPWIVAVYVGAMLTLGLHLRHGAWSMLQSLGMMNSRAAKIAYPAGVGLAILLAFGFIVLPLYVFVALDPIAPATLVPVGDLP